MEDLKIVYSLPAKVKIPALVSGGFLFALAVGVGIFQALHSQLGFSVLCRGCGNRFSNTVGVYSNRLAIGFYCGN